MWSTYLSLLIRPRRAIREILEVDPSHYALALAFAFGFAINFFQIFTRMGHITTYADWGQLVKGCLYQALLKGVVQIYFFFGYMFWWVGTKLGAPRGSLSEVRSALAWSGLPAVCLAVIWGVTVCAVGFDFMRPPATPGTYPVSPLGLSLIIRSPLPLFGVVGALVQVSGWSDGQLLLPGRDPVGTADLAFWIAVSLVLAALWVAGLVIATLSEVQGLSLGKVTAQVCGIWVVSEFLVQILWKIQDLCHWG